MSSTPSPAPNPALAAAAPSLIAMVQALQQFNANMGPDPLQWVAKFPGAYAILIGTVELQLPAIAVAEGAAAMAAADAKFAGWITQLKAL